MPLSLKVGKEPSYNVQRKSPTISVVGGHYLRQRAGPRARRQFGGTDPCVHSSYVPAEQKIQTKVGSK